jgi:DNA invertase Pin-like site-specific DNA recombinase
MVDLYLDQQNIDTTTPMGKLIFQITGAFAEFERSTKDRKQRPGLYKMLNDASRGKFDIVMAWAIDRVGRSLTDLLRTIQHLEACGAGLVRARKAGKVLGRARIDAEIENAIEQSLAKGRGIRETARDMGVGNGTVQRIKAEMSAD